MRRFAAVVILGSILAVVPAPIAAGFDDAAAAYERGDFATAMKELKPLADAGDPRAQFIVGSLYYDGRGVAQDRAEAAKWYRLAAERGYVNAGFLLAVLYKFGTGVAQDLGQAVRWFRMSAEGGNVRAQYDLALMLTKGEGVERDNAEAYLWCEIALAGGNANAAPLRDALARALSPAQIAEAQAKARAWKPVPPAPGN